MSSTVWGLINKSNPNWDAVRNRIGTHPSEANCKKNKPLYAAVGHNHVPPLDIISSLLVSLRKKKVTECEKLDILTEACYNINMKGDVLMTLLESFDLKPSMEFVFRLSKDIMSFTSELYSDEEDDDFDEGDAIEGDGLALTASSCTVAALVQYWPNVLTATDKNGNLLLHHACSKGHIPIHLIATILDISIRHKFHIDKKDGDIQECNEYHHGGLLTMNRQKRTPLQNLCRIMNDHDDENAIDKIILCSRICPNLPILHAGTIIHPRHFKQLIVAMKLNGIQDVTTSLKDQFNRSLIQVTIDNTSTNSIRYGKEIMNILLQSSCGGSEEVGMEEEVTFASFRDETNRLPLHQACELGLSWDDGLEDILNANVNALEDIDEVTSMYPFMLAATAMSTLPIESTSTTQKSMCDLSSVYQLLRKYPNIIEISRQNYFSNCH